MLAILSIGQAYGDTTELAGGNYGAISEGIDYSYQGPHGEQRGGGLGSVSIHGTSAYGTRSFGYVYREPWYDATGPHYDGVVINNPLVIRQRVDVYDSGLLEISNAPVQALGTVSIRDGGQLWIKDGTLQVANLSLSGTGNASDPIPGYSWGYSGALVRQGSQPTSNQAIKAGHLSLDDGATMTFRDDDEITAGVSIGFGSTLTLQKHLTTGQITLSGSDAVLDTRSATFTTDQLFVEDGNVFVLGANQVTSEVTVFNGGQVTGNFYLNASNPLGSRINLWCPNALSGNFSTAQLALDGGADVTYSGSDSITDSVEISGSSTLRLQQHLDLRNGYQFGTLTLVGPDAAIEKNGHAVLVRNLELFGAQYTFDAGDGVTTSVDVGGGGVLTLNGDIAVSDLIRISGSDALVRNGHSYAAARLELTGQSLAYRSADSVTDSLKVEGGTFSLEKDLALTGTLTLTSSDALVTNGHSYAARDIVLGTGGGFGPIDAGVPLGFGIPLIPPGFGGFGFPGPTGMNLVYREGDSITNSVEVNSGSSLTLARDIALGGGLTVSGSTGLVLNGHHYSAASLSIRNGQNMTYQNGDFLTDSVVIGNGSTLTLDKDLVLSGSVTLIGTGTIIANGHSYRAPGLLDSPLAPHAELTSISLMSGTDQNATGASFAAGAVGESGAEVQLSFTAGQQGQYSSILHLQGTDGLSQVLQLSYDPTGLSLDDQKSLALVWLDGTGHWVNSVLGNHNQPNPVQMASAWQGSWNDYFATQQGKTLDALLGAYGVDINAHIVWAAINHNSEFAVSAVPEPSSIILAGIGILGGVLFSRRREWRERRNPRPSSPSSL